jgi:hypothetical protein
VCIGLSTATAAPLQAFAGIVTVSVGHCHPEVVAAVNKQNELLQHTTTIYLNNQIAEYAKELADKMPGDLKVSTPAAAAGASAAHRGTLSVSTDCLPCPTTLCGMRFVCWQLKQLSVQAVTKPTDVLACLLALCHFAATACLTLSAVLLSCRWCTLSIAAQRRMTWH